MRDRAYANFIVGTGLAFTFHQYLALTVNQRAEIAEASRRMARQMRR